MDNMEEKLGAILGNPQMMQQIMSMAQSLGQSQTPNPPRQEPTPLADMDPSKLQQMMQFVGQTGIDRNQQALLNALNPFLTRQRIGKLERAMRAAKLAGVASSLLGSGMLQL